MFHSNDAVIIFFTNLCFFNFFHFHKIYHWKPARALCITKNIAGDDVRHLLKAEDEYVVKGRFERIFPTANSYKYLNFMEARYYNRLFDAWEHKYASNREEG